MNRFLPHHARVNGGAQFVWNAVLLDSVGGNGESSYLCHGIFKMIDAGSGAVLFDFGDTIGETFGQNVFQDPQTYQFISLRFVQFADGSSIYSSETPIPIIA